MLHLALLLPSGEPLLAARALARHALVSHVRHAGKGVTFASLHAGWVRSADSVALQHHVGDVTGVAADARGRVWCCDYQGHCLLGLP